MTNVIELLKAAKIASNDFQASHIANGLKLASLHTDEAMIERAKLYRKWRPRTDKKNDIPTWQAYQLAMAGIDPADVAVRQMELEEQQQEPEPPNMVQISRDMAIDAGDRSMEGQWIQW